MKLHESRSVWSRVFIMRAVRETDRQTLKELSVPFRIFADAPKNLTSVLYALDSILHSISCL
jgi:hypothetical protein